MASRNKGKNFQKILVSQTVQSGMSSEEKQEEVKRWNQNNKLLTKIEENTRGVGGGGDPRVSPDNETGGPSIGVMGAMLAAALGTMVGMIQGHIKAIKFFGEKLLPNKLITGIGEKMTAMKNFFSKGIDRILGFFRGFRDMFGKAGGGTFTKIMEAMKTGVAAVKNFFKPIGEAFKMVKSGGGFLTKMITGIKSAFTGFFSFFRGLGSSMKAFSGIFSAVAKVVGKIFFPLTVIMTLWDTVKGAFAGFEEDGIVGVLTGAVKGFVNSLLMAPLDMLKKGISFLAGAFGFDKAQEWLNSFSFEGLFSGLMDGLTDSILAIPEYIGNMVDWIGEKITSAMEFVADVFDMYIIEPLSSFVTDYIIDPIKAGMSKVGDFFGQIKDQILKFLYDFGIPAIGFTIPVVGTEVSVGPFYPFRPEEGTDVMSASTTSTTTTDSDGNVSEEMLDNIVNTENERSTVVVSGMTAVENADGTSSATVGDALVELDTTTGIASATIGDQEYELENSTFRTIKARAAEGNLGMDELQEIIAEDQAYQDERLSFFDRRKVDVGYASAREILAQKMDEQSVDNSVARSAPASSGGNTNVVNAPTTNSSTTAVTYKPNIRNPQPTVAMSDVY